MFSKLFNIPKSVVLFFSPLRGEKTEKLRNFVFLKGDEIGFKFPLKLTVNNKFSSVQYRYKKTGKTGSFCVSE